MRTYIVGLLLILFLPYCQKNGDSNTENPIDPNENLLNDNTHIVDTSCILSVSINSLIIDKSITLLRPKIGDILISPPTSTNPYGFLSEVISVSESNNQIICTVQPSNLYDAFKQLNIDYSYTDTSTTNATFRTGPLINITFQNNNSLINGLRLNGVLKVNVASTQLKYIRKAGSLKPAKILIQFDLNTEGSSIEIENSSASDIQLISEQLLWPPINLPTITIPIVIPGLPIPIPLTFTQKILLKWLPLAISGKAKWSCLPIISATFGAKYENGILSDLSSYSISSTASNPLRNDFEPTLSLSAKFTFFKPVYEISPYGIDALKAYFEIPNRLDFTVQTATPNYQLKYTLELKGGVKLKFWDGIEHDFNVNGSISKTILQGNWIDQPPLVLTATINNITQTTARTGGNITSDGGSNVTSRGVCWNTNPSPTITNNKTTNGSGAGSYTSNLSGLIPNTTYYVRAYAINSFGTGYGNEYNFTTDPTSVTLPIIATIAISGITQTSSQSGGIVSSDGGAAVTARGVCWSTTQNPTTANNKSTNGTGTGSFNSSLTGLNNNTTYHVRAYATNIVGTAYGNQISFNTQQSGGIGTVTDIDGNIYNTVTIGTQVWMKENLKVTHYRNGEPIPNVTDNIQWYNLTTGAYCNYNNETNNGTTYGRLYNWYAVSDIRKVAPTGWHLPTYAEWAQLINYLGAAAGGKMKAIGTIEDGTGLWYRPNTGADNSTEFTGLPGGVRGQDGTGILGKFGGLGYVTDWWGSTVTSTSGVWVLSIRYLGSSANLLESGGNLYGFGYSVRCIKD